MKTKNLLLSLVLFLESSCKSSSKRSQEDLHSKLQDTSETGAQNLIIDQLFESIESDRVANINISDVTLEIIKKIVDKTTILKSTDVVKELKEAMEGVKRDEDKGDYNSELLTSKDVVHNNSHVKYTISGNLTAQSAMSGRNACVLISTGSITLGSSNHCLIIAKENISLKNADDSVLIAKNKITVEFANLYYPTQINFVAALDTTDVTKSRTKVYSLDFFKERFAESSTASLKTLEYYLSRTDKVSHETKFLLGVPSACYSHDTFPDGSYFRVYDYSPLEHYRIGFSDGSYVTIDALKSKVIKYDTQGKVLRN